MDVRLLLGAADCIESASGARRCRFDELDAAGAMLLARSFAGLPTGLPRRHPVEPFAVDPVRLGDVAALDPAVSWRPRPGDDLLRVPIGTAQDGTPLVLDLKESARGGMGPHGLVVGATGSGKSELLRSLVPRWRSPIHPRRWPCYSPTSKAVQRFPALPSCRTWPA